MKKCLAIFSLSLAVSLTAASAFAVPIAGSAYWSFNTGSPGVISGAYTTTDSPTYSFSLPDEEALPGTPILRVEGTHILNGNINGTPVAASYTSTSGTVWPNGRSLQFERDDEGNASINNSFTLQFNSTGFEDFILKFQYRLTNGMSYAMTAIEYSLDNLIYQSAGVSVPSTGNGLTANSNWHQLTFDFSALDAIENQSSVFIRFSLPNFTADNNSFKIDNVELTSTQMVPEPTSILLVGLSTIGIGCVIRARKSGR